MSSTERFFWRWTKCVNNLEGRLEKYFRLKEPQCLSAVFYNSPSMSLSRNLKVIPIIFLSFNVFLHSNFSTTIVSFYVVFWIAAIRIATFSFLQVVEAATAPSADIIVDVVNGVRKIILVRIYADSFRLYEYLEEEKE